eukprot:CAMPEP_0179277700 /NCGR_PEP_ID=MMETSP0797-20121207/35229_1 /TAXON_ID=47934 /ORGANISM="Dinophysis acuminata, Strain DAEP01" /LENGTH=439 /DNA_ID=CAMNT_0020986297 /DNA_START=33 /DNA_END=1353 /DNA_ORIENTATION=-
MGQAADELPKCANPPCWFVAHRSPEFGGYCCKRCQTCHVAGASRIEHGALCERRRSTAPGLQRLGPAPGNPSRGSAAAIAARGEAAVDPAAPARPGQAIDPPVSGDERALAIESTTSADTTGHSTRVAGEVAEEHPEDSVVTVPKNTAVAVDTDQEPHGVNGRCSNKDLDPDLVDLLTEQRRDPEVWDWVTFEELKERYAGDYTEIALKQYWEEECEQDRRTDADGSLCTWADFRSKHGDRWSPVELRCRWRKCGWPGDEAQGDAGDSGPDAPQEVPRDRVVGDLGERRTGQELRRDTDGEVHTWWEFRMKHDGHGSPAELRMWWNQCTWLEGDDAKEREAKAKDDARALAILNGDTAGPDAAAPGEEAAVTDVAVPRRDPYEDTLRWMSAWDKAADRAGFAPPVALVPPPSAGQDGPGQGDGGRNTRGGLYAHQQGTP